MEKVSIIVPTHNSSLFIRECITSIINQGYDNIEIIVVDDYSNDNTIDIIKEFNEKRIKIIFLNKHYGAAYARNIGIDKANGNLICFLDSDDYWYPNKLKKQIAFIKDKPFIYSGYSFYKNGKTKDVMIPTSITYKEALKNTTIFTSTVMFNMNYLKKEDIYMPNIESEDTACWWKVLKKVDQAFGINEPLSIYRVNHKSLSSNKIKAINRTWKLYKSENISLPKRLYYFAYYIKNAIKRRI